MYVMSIILWRPVSSIPFTYTLHQGANILVDHNGKIKLADFGASKKIESLVTMADGYKTFTGTPYYMVGARGRGFVNILNEDI